MTYLGDFKLNSTVLLPLTTSDGYGAAVAPLSAYEAADFKIYKDGGTAEKTTTNGVTISSPFDSLTGLHMLSLDTSNNTGDTNWWQAGHDYFVILNADTETVDGQTVIAVVGLFSIENRCVNWAQVVSPTTTVGLSGTTVGTTTALTNAPSDSSGTTTLLSRVTSGRATNLDNLDATVSSRSTLTQTQVTGGAYALNTDGSGNVKVSSGTGANQISLASGLVTVGTNNDKTGYTASTVSDKTGYALTSAYDAAKTASQAGDAMALTSGERTTLSGVIWNVLTSALTTVGSIGKLIVDFLDVAVSSRSTYAGGDTSGTTTLLSRLTSGRATNLDNLDATVSSRSSLTQAQVTGGAYALSTDGSGNVKISSGTGANQVSLSSGTVTVGTNNDKTGYALTSAYDAAKTASQAGDSMALTSGERTTLAGVIWNVLTSALTTVGSIGKLIVDNLNATVSSRSTYAGTDTSGTTTLLSRLTSGRATNLDNLDAAISTRLATSGYTSPPSAATISTQVDSDLTTSHGSGSWQSVAVGNVTVGGYASGQDPATLVLDALAADHDIADTIGESINSGSAVSTIYGESGSETFTYTVYDVGGITPLAGVAVFVSSDIAGTTRSQTKISDALGRVQFDLIPGTVYFWRSRIDRSFSNPDTEVVS